MQKGTRIIPLKGELRDSSEPCSPRFALGLFLTIFFATPSSAQKFVDVTPASGVTFRHNASKTSQKYLIEAMGSGVALLDYDADGLLDIFFVNGAQLSDPMPLGRKPDKSAPQYWNRLYRNLGDWRFRDVSEEAGVQGEGYGMGVAVGDYDNDGFPDLFVSNFGRDLLYRNLSDGTFKSTALGGDSWSAGAAFLDYNRDGLLDLFVARYLDWRFDKNIPCGPFLPDSRSYCHPRRFAAVAHTLYRNLGASRFQDASTETGIDEFPGKGLGVALGDFDSDGWVDIFVANDSYPQQLFRNQRGRTFEEVGVQAGVAYDADGSTYAGMGVSWADYDGDALPDLFVNALGRQGYWLYRNRKGEFEPASRTAGLSAITTLSSGWGAGLVDLDNDGWRDLFVAQGHVMDDIGQSDPALSHREPLMLLKNLFGRFFDVSSKGGEALHKRYAARGAAFGDLDNNGLIDIVVSVSDDRPLLLKNVTASTGHSLTIELKGNSANRDAIGATVRLTTRSGRRQTSFVSPSGSYLSSSSNRVHFGFPPDDPPSELTITWPDDAQETISAPAPGSLTVTQRPPSEPRR